MSEPETPIRTAADVMERRLTTVTPDTSVRELARLLLVRGSDGACVVDEGRLAGVVTTMDLVYREKRITTPHFITFLDIMIPLESRVEITREIERVSGLRADEIMSVEAVTVKPDTPISEAASLMVDRHLTMLPVVDESNSVIGVVTKRSLLRAVFRFDDEELTPG